jgi:hypothetical protein
VTDEYVEVTVDVFDERGQRAAVLGSATAAGLIDEILREFSDLQAAGPERYSLFLADTRRSLAPGKTLAEQGVQSGDRLVFGWADAAGETARRPVSRPGWAGLRDEASGRKYPITWQPARIGRPDADATHNAQLLVDVQWLPDGGRVSRRHAEVTERGGVYYLEALAAQNPTLLNGQRVSPSQPVPINPGDRIGLGGSAIVLRFEAGTPS